MGKQKYDFGHLPLETVVYTYVYSQKKHLCSKCTHILEGDPHRYYSSYHGSACNFCPCADVTSTICDKEENSIWVTGCKNYAPESGFIYALYMNSDVWDSRKNEQMEEDGYKCKICGTAKNLTVHHTSYARLCEEKPGDLITVCNECHKKLHENDFKSKKEPQIVETQNTETKEDSMFFEMLRCQTHIKNQRISVALKPSTRKKLKEDSTNMHLSMNSYIEKLIEKGL